MRETLHSDLLAFQSPIICGPMRGLGLVIDGQKTTAYVKFVYLIGPTFPSITNLQNIYFFYILNERHKKKLFKKITLIVNINIFRYHNFWGGGSDL